MKSAISILGNEIKKESIPMGTAKGHIRVTKQLDRQLAEAITDRYLIFASILSPLVGFCALLPLPRGKESNKNDFYPPSLQRPISGTANQVVMASFQAPTPSLTRRNDNLMKVIRRLSAWERACAESHPDHWDAAPALREIP
ncbi:hypothetical protein NPIL_280711 [Nephila pilipes]|uniref:Uncharacterized protein n=1 Tax=Nephila pilipes TaxID=299642 RepID=A0A8X6KG71_NEPPI|nr:hypothetical protein NPIL_280711 [Nephila pilipes]